MRGKEKERGRERKKEKEIRLREGEKMQEFQNKFTNIILLVSFNSFIFP